jgi:hypothetical protein
LITTVSNAGFQPNIGVALELLDHIGPAADRLVFPALGAGGGIGLLRQHVAGQEGHPLEQRRLEFLDVGGDGVAVDAEVVDLAPDELDRVAARGIAGALQRPDHVFGGDRGAVVPERVLAHRHQHLGLVLVPAPFGQQAGLEGQVGVLVDIGIEHRLVIGLDGRVDRRRPGGRVPRRQRNVVGDGQDLLFLAAARQQQRTGKRRGGGSHPGRLQEAAARENVHREFPLGGWFRPAAPLFRERFRRSGRPAAI